MPKAKIKRLRAAIEKLTKWESSGKAFGFIKGVPDSNEHYIYEFFCAMRVLKDLKKNHDIELKPGSLGHKFPRSPGDKSKWARFLIMEKGTKNVKMQFCLGTEVKISSSPMTTFGADISFQKWDAPDNPDETHIVLIMDGKYKTSNESKLDISTIREFAQCVTDMQVPKIQKSKLLFDKLMNLKTNCLFTNGDAIDDHEQYCKNNKLKQVGRFDFDGRKMKVIG